MTSQADQVYDYTVPFVLFCKLSKHLWPGYIPLILSFILIPTAYFILNFKVNQWKQKRMMNVTDYLTMTLNYLSSQFVCNWFGLEEFNFLLQQFVCEYDYVQLRFICVSSIWAYDENNYRW